MFDLRVPTDGKAPSEFQSSDTFDIYVSEIIK